MFLFIFLVSLVLTFAAIRIPETPISISTTTVLPITSTEDVFTTTTDWITPITVPTRKLDAKTMKLEQRLPFLKGADELSRQEFFSIIQDDKLSKAEIWEKVESWAAQQSGHVQADVVEFHQMLSQHVESSKGRVERIIKSLPTALQKLSEIVQDIEITRLQEKNRIANLYSSLDEDVSKTLQWIVQLVSYEKNEGKQLERRSKLRKLKKGGVWTGSVQATNII